MHVVVTGQARHLAGYGALLDRISQARRVGAIHSVTLVHWKTQAGVIQDVLASRPTVADRVLLLDEPEFKSPGHFLHQAYSLEHGLDGRADDEMVLRLRPDVYVDEAFLPRMAQRLATLDRPLWSPFADVTCPFFACDMVFAGRASALRAQTNYSLEPYLVTTPAGFARQPGRVYNHEPEVQRWLHPVRTSDWRFAAYWAVFPSFGLVTRRRRALMARYAAWDFYQALRLGWLDYLEGNVCLGGLAGVGRLGLVRTEAPESPEGTIQWLDQLPGPADVASEATLAREHGALVWTNDVAQIAGLSALLRRRASPERRLSPEEVRAELADHWRAIIAQVDPTAPLPAPLFMPYLRNIVRY